MTTVRAARAILGRLGVLGLLDVWASRSRTAHWIRSWFAIYDLEEMVRLGVPWWTYAAIDYVDEHLRRHLGARVFEWGSGASTVWLAARADEVTAIEHDEAWAHAMGPHLTSSARVRAIPPIASARPVIGSRKPGFEGLDFSDYVGAIDVEGGLFDLVVIDGRAREACVRRAFARLAPGGLVVVDNVDRKRYRDAIAELGPSVEVLWTRGRTPSLPYPTRTALLRHAAPR